MSKGLKIACGIFVLSTALALVLGIFILPGKLKSKEKEAIAKLEKKGVTIKYASLDPSLSGSLLFNDLTISTKKGGMSFDCHFKKIRIDLSLLDSFSGTHKPKDIQVENGQCDIEKEKKNIKKEKLDNPKQAKSFLKSDIIIPPIKVVDTTFRFKQHSLQINDFSSPSNGPIQGNLTLRALGEKYEMKVSGQVENGQQINLSLSPQSAESFNVNILGNKFNVGLLGANLFLNRSAADVFVENMNVERKGFSIQTKQAYLDFQPDQKPKFVIADSKFRFDKNILKNFVSNEKSAKDNFDDPAPLVSPFAILDKLEVHFSEFALSMQLGEREIGLIEHAHGKWVRGALDVYADIAKGKIKASAIINAKDKKLYRLNADLENIQLGAVPGMPSGRSELPNRGTSGKLDGTISGALRLRTPWHLAVNNPIEYAMNLQWTDGVLDLEGVSEEPLDGIEVTSLIQGKVNLSTFEAFNDGVFNIRDLPFSFQSKVVGWPNDLTASLALKGEKRPCEHYFSAFPHAVWGPLKNASLSGDAKVEIDLEYPHARPEETNLAVDGYKECVVKNLRSTQKLKVKIPGKNKPNFTDMAWLKKAFTRKVREVDAGKEIFVGPGTQHYTLIEDLPKHVGGAAYLSEQVNFYDGRAVNFSLVQKALRRNLDEGRFVYGGSTITQQLVKNLFLTRDKTLARKLQEVLIAWRMESFLTKDEILELYLNCIEFGPNLYGIGPAALHYFQKSAKNLTPKESVFLAMLKPAPWRGVWYVKKGETPTNPYFLERTDILLDRLLDDELITEELLKSEKRVGLTWEEGKYKRIELSEVEDEDSGAVTE